MGLWCSRLVRRWGLGVALVGAMLVPASTAFAQLDRGSISGTVKDQSGAVVPGVTVTATSAQTLAPRVAVTDGSGFYTFPNLQAGKYNLSVELSGFKKIVRDNVQLDAAGAINIDFSLETGAVSEQVTVTAEQPPLQTDTALRKTIESKDIEQLSFNGRNPIGVASLKAGVIGGSFNNYGFSSLSNGGFNINGSRSDENNITVDGATAIRTRSSGAIVGVQNVDALQEVQVLTGNYMPEYGRASGGQVRMVTKSGSSRFSGSASFFYRDDSLQANTWSRNRSASTPDPAPFDYKQYGYSFGGPVPFGMFKDKLFFFGAQEWVNYFAADNRAVTVPTAKMRAGDFSELLDPNNGFFTTARVIVDPRTGQPFKDNIIPTDRLSANGIAMLNAFPLPTPGFRQGTANAFIESDNPQDQRKDNIRLDYRLNDRNQFMYRYGKYNWTAVDAFRGNLPYARTDWDRPNSNHSGSWTSTITNNLINEASFTYSLDEVYINVFKSDLYSRAKYGINYPYIFPENKEIPDKIPTISIDGLTEIDGGPYPSSSVGPIYTFNNTTTYVRGRHTFKGGLTLEYSGEDDFDQINVQPIPGSTNNQNGRFQFTNASAGANSTGTAIANTALGLFTNYAEIGQRALTKWRALATDIFVQDSWKPTSKLTVEGGIRWAIWPPWHSLTNNIATFDPGRYNTSNQAVIDPSTGRIVSGPLYNGILLPGDGFEGDGNNLAVASNPAVQALFDGAPRGFAETHYNALEPRLGVSYAFDDKTVFKANGGIFHNRVTLNDSMLLGGNPPFQPQVGVTNGSADNPGSGGAALPFSMTAIDPVFKHPTAYLWSFGVQREVPFGFVVDVTYVGRRGLYLQRERDINQLLPGTVQANPGINPAALRPYKGFGTIRLSENAGYSKYNSLQISADRRYRNGFKFGAAYTLGHSRDNASGKRDVLFNNFDDTGFWGNSDFDRRHVFNFYYIYDLPFYREQTGAIGKVLGGWQISGATFMRTGTPLWVTEGADIAGTGDTFGNPWNLNGDPKANANEEFSTGSDANYWFDPTVFSRPAPGTFGNGPRRNIYNPGQYQWDIALFKNVNLGGSRVAQFRAEVFNFPNHANWNGAEANPTSGSFGRVTGKDNSVRDIQLSIRFLF